MFSTAYQPSPLCLFSSTSTRALDLFSVHVDESLPVDSFIHFLNDATSTPSPSPPKSLVKSANTVNNNEEDWLTTEGDAHRLEGQFIIQTVLHIQSPTLCTTYIRSPPLPGRDLGITLPHLHMQVCDLGRAWSFEVGIVDRMGKAGVIRCSTFQHRERLSLSAPQPLLHLPLSFPSSSYRPSTSWATISIDLAALLPYFSTIPHSDRASQSELSMVPSGQFSHVSYIKIYATCRLRRVWFTQTKMTPVTRLPWEFELYGS